MTEDNENRTLYRFQYWEPEDQCNYVEWVWLTDDEVDKYRSSDLNVTHRRATEEEKDLYNEAYADGYGIAAMMEFESTYDGVTFRVEMGKDGELDFNGKKMFECAVCANHKDFDDEVAMCNDLYLGVIKDDKLWHVCYDCGLLGTEIGSIEIEITGEDES